MPKRKIYLGKIKNHSPIKEEMAKRSLKNKSLPVLIRFDYGVTARLDLSYPRAAVWARMIDLLQKDNRPVYVEIDTETSNIIKLYMPKAARVLRIEQSDKEEVVYVYFSTSHARHYLRRNREDFQQMLDALSAQKDADETLLVTATHDDFEIIDVRPLPTSFGNDGPPEPPPPPEPDPPVSWDRAVELFNMMNVETCSPCSSTSPCISYKYPYDGCWIRAHLMCYLMRDEGETPEKIWITGSLTALSSNVPQCYVNWGWHIAPTLMVTQASGPDIKMVIDPSLCDGPVTPEEWKSLQGDPSATLTPSTWEGYGYLASGTASRATADHDMEYYRLELDEMCSDYGSSPYTCPIVRKSFFIVDRSTVSKDEIDAMLISSNPAVIEAAFYFVVDGFTPSELGITTATLSGVPNIIPTFSFLPGVAQMTIDVMPTIRLEDPTHFIRRQRITWKYNVSFTGSSGFVDELEEITLSASITSVSGTIATVSANAKLYLTKQPNPYEIDGETAWLSTDLRVFQIREGDTSFNRTMVTDAAAFITGVIQNLNTGTAGQTFDSISVNQQTSRLELSESVDSVRIYNFAVARVRYRAVALSATDVRVFFRLFPASSTSLEYNSSTTYRRIMQAGSLKPLLGIISGETVTIPCFAAARIDSSAVSMTQQTDPANVQVILPDASGQEVIRYFGCWLDINQTQPQFPLNPSPVDGPYSVASRLSVQEHVRNEHQCLVAEIAFDPMPIPANASPSTSDKLAQRNLAIVASANPGDIASHRIPHIFEIKPSRIKQGSEELPDELMIDWGNVPAGCTATLYFSGIDTNDILDLSIQLYRQYSLVRIDVHTLRCQTGGMTYIPVPSGQGSNYVGMLSVDLPATVKKGQVYTIVVHQITGRQVKSDEIMIKVAVAASMRGRHVLGSFQVTIPVLTKERMLKHEEVLLSNLRWIRKAIPQNNRWFPVFNRYVKQIGDRVDALGGNSRIVAASPSDDWKKRRKKNKIIFFGVVGLLSILIITIVAKTKRKRR